MATETTDAARRSQGSNAGPRPMGAKDPQVGEAASATDAGPAESTLRASADRASARAKLQAGKLAREARDRARTIANDQKRRSAERLDGMAVALRQTARHLDDEGEVATARYVEQAGDTVEWLSTELRDRDIDSIVEVAEDLARRRPVAFFGGAVAGGILLARFLKSSAKADDENAHGDTHEDASEDYDLTMPDAGASRQGSIL